MDEAYLKGLISKFHDSKTSREEKEKIGFLLGDHFYSEKEYEKARAIFKVLLEKNSKLERAHYFLALIELEENNLEKAKKELINELKINPKADYAKKLQEKLVIHSTWPLVTITLIIVNIIAFTLSYPEIPLSSLIKYALYKSSITIPQVITSLFFHANILHLVINMLVLLVFGLYLEKHIGSFKFLAVYLISGILGNIAQTLISNSAFILGASTAIFGIIGAIVMREPLLDIRIFGIIKVPIIVVFAFFFTVEQFILSNDVSGVVSYGSIAHIIGFLVGILVIAIFYQETIPTFYNWLGIAAGFWMATYSAFALRGIFSLSILDIVYFMCILVIGVLLVIYSYHTLKRVRQEVITHEGA